MRFRTHWTSIAAATVAAALLAGCGGGGSQGPAGSTLPSSSQQAKTLIAQSRGVVGPNTSSKTTLLTMSGQKLRTHVPHNPITNTVFVGDTTLGIIAMFDFKSKAMVGQIGGLSAPEGLSTDAAGNLYESDTGTQAIQIFAPPYSGTPTKVQEHGFYPAGNHIDGNGNLWVANICSGSGGSCSGGGNVTEYKGAKGKPVVLNGGPYRAYFITTDSHGNVWADGQDSNFFPIIGYWTGGTGSFHAVSIPLVFPGGVQFDNAGNLMLDDQSGDPNNGGSILDIIPPGSTTIGSQITIQNNGDDVIATAIGTANARVFAPGYLSGPTNIITYPAGAMVNTFPTTGGNPASIALVPATLP